jgi:GH25 family lysozyme M1 (1,4-beta-N-acetylmuramidase)
MTVLGIDISSYQGRPDMNAVRNAGIGFVFIKATENVNYVNPYFGVDRQDAKNAGLVTGFYHFARGTDPVAEANYFCNAVGSLQQGDLVALDWEISHVDPVGWSLQWLRTVEGRFGAKPLIYLNKYLEGAFNWTPVVQGNYGLWLANYDYSADNPQPPVVRWDFVAIEQYSDKAGVPGVGGGVDADVFYGDIATLVKYGFGGGSAPVPAPPAPAPVPQPAVDFPYPHDECFGLITDPSDKVHGGINEQEKVYVRQIQQKLIDLGFAPNEPGWADGVYEQATVDAVANWQRARMPGTTIFGQVWFDDWAALIQGNYPAPPPPPAPAPPAPAPNIPHWPLPENEYFGLITGPNESHGGINGVEKTYVRMIQQKLQQLGYAPNYGGWADGVFEQATADSVSAFQRDHMPGTEFFGQVWHDDWNRLFSL